MIKKSLQFIVWAGLLFISFQAFSESAGEQHNKHAVDDPSTVVWADLRGANLREADLSGANITLDDLKAYFEAKREYEDLYGRHPIDRVFDDLSAYYQSEHVILEDEVHSFIEASRRTKEAFIHLVNMLLTEMGLNTTADE